MAESKTKAEKVSVKLDTSKNYTIVATGKGKHMVKGDEYEVSGENAQYLVDSGQATVK